MAGRRIAAKYGIARVCCSILFVDMISLEMSESQPHQLSASLFKMQGGGIRAPACQYNSAQRATTINDGSLN